jgi:hypothetical protein
MKLFSSLAFALSIAVVVGCASNHDLSLSTSRLRTETCKATTEAEIAALFDRWDQSLQTGDPHKVVSNYAERSMLLPTVSNKSRLTPSEKEDYFHHFLVYFFENVLTPNVFWVDLKKVDFSENASVKKLTLEKHETYAGDAVDSFKNASPFKFQGL